MKKIHQACLGMCLAILGVFPAFASQNVDEVIRLNKSGASADVMVAFVDKSTSDPHLSADDLVLMNDAGVPAAVIEEMLRKEKAATADVGGTDVAAVATVAPSADNADISYFYSTLSTDGAWTNDNEYGWSWSPAVAVSDPNWRPYVDNGSWVYTDDGWYWNSGYNWGWAAFHYGRWSHRENNWYWHPDNVWGSSWVSWRNNEGVYGWAPLTPRARFGSGGFAVALTTGNFDVNIGLGERDYYFVHSNNFLEVNLNRHGIDRNESANIYRNSTITNNYTFNNNRVANVGIPVRNVAVATKHDIKPVSIVDHPAKAGEAVRAGGIQNNRIEVFRPTLAAKASLDPVAAASRRPVTGNRAPVTADRDTAKKAEIAKRVSERAAKEPPLKPRATETPRRDTPDPRAVTTPSRPSEVKPPAAEHSTRVPEVRENSHPEVPKAHEVTPKAPDVTPKAPDVTPKAPDVTPKAPDVKTPAAERNPRAPEPRENIRPEPPKAHEAAPKVREEAPAPHEPVRAEPKAREEAPRKAEPAPRIEK